jgi:hypothetical protein
LWVPSSRCYFSVCWWSEILVYVLTKCDAVNLIFICPYPR